MFATGSYKQVVTSKSPANGLHEPSGDKNVCLSSTKDIKLSGGVVWESSELTRAVLDSGGSFGFRRFFESKSLSKPQAFTESTGAVLNPRQSFKSTTIIWINGSHLNQWVSPNGSLVYHRGSFWINYLMTSELNVVRNSLDANFYCKSYS